MFELVTGIVLLVSGIFTMRFGLKKAFWYKFKNVIIKATKTPLHALLLGIGSAALFQSSTTVCLITIGLVSSEYMSFRQAVGIILGANIGTCSTVQLVNFTLPVEILLSLLVLSLLLTLHRKIKYFSFAFAGLISLLTGVTFLTKGIASISELDAVCSYLAVAQSSPFYAIGGGIGLTFAFQSSSAATAFIMLLISDGLIDIVTAAYIIYGNNIGSCVSSVVFSAAAPPAARRVAVSHIILNVAGTAAFLPFTNLLVSTTASITSDLGTQVALIHLLFNVLSSVIAFLFLNMFTRLVYFLVPSR